ncbi:MAG: HlyC/CorC family transporter [Bacteroidetes bacterium]|nr:HlyC/CorC family transporter [Bacteroidota bacterium]
MDNSVIIFITLVACAFFSGIEIAFISSNKLRLELKSKQGHTIANLLSPFVKNPSKFISTTLVGNNISLVIYSIFMEQKILHPFFEAQFPEQGQLIKVLLETLISTLFILFTAEFLPKVLFRINPDFVLEVLAYPFLFFYYLFYPLVHGITWLSRKMLVNFFKLEWNEGYAAFSKIDLDRYVSESSHHDIKEDAEVDTEIFKNALDFGMVKARECMIPRTEIVAVDATVSIEELYAKFIESNHSKILIYEGTIDHIIGYVHQTSLFTKPKTIKQCLIPIVIANESMAARELLNKLTYAHKSMAVVVDEFGGTAGIVAIEDILEEILGEIKDEHDDESLTEKTISENSYIFSARLEVDYINEKYKMQIPVGDYETLGGYIFSIHESIPEKNEIIVDDLYEYTIISVDNTHIKDIQIHILNNN